MNQKEEENLVMQFFRDNYSDFPKCRVIQSESPDFILKINPKKSIGVELTQMAPKADSLFERIDASLINKNDKLRLYQKKNFQAIWLVIYTDFIAVPKSFNIRNKLENWHFSSRYDKVFLFDLFEKRAFLLNQ